LIDNNTKKHQKREKRDKETDPNNFDPKAMAEQDRTNEMDYL
jgi:hypothetical protein